MRLGITQHLSGQSTVKPLREELKRRGGGEEGFNSDLGNLH